MPSKINARMVKFTMTGSNEYWDILKEAQDLHVSARDRHEDLLALCKDKGVKFTDLRNHLLNEAKKVGLYFRNKWEEKSGSMVYPGFTAIKDYSWGHALHTFLNYANKKYIEYGVEAPVKEPRVTLIKRTKPVMEVQEGAAGGTKVTLHHTGENGTETTETIEDRRHAPENVLIVPLAEPLGLDKIKLLVHANLGVLEELAAEAGVHDEFLEVMRAMGLVEQIEEFDLQGNA